MALSIDDPRLVASFRAGENEAFEALVRAHRPALYRHALRKLSDHAAAEDAVQETFTRAYKGRARVGDDWRLGAWLHQICANVCIDEANRRRRESTKSSRWATAEVSQHTAPTLEDQLGLDADHGDVVRALRDLPDNFQEALELRYVAELEYDEMAEVLDISEDNARARVSRASKAIRVLLRPVAAIIAFFAAFSFRRGGKGGRVLAATAHSASDSVGSASSATVTNVATQVTQSASMFAPLVETAQAVAIQAPHAMPLISKAAIGLGVMVVATSPATAPIVIDQFRDSEPAAVTAQADAPQDAAAPVAPAVSTPTDAAVSVPTEAASTPSGDAGSSAGGATGDATNADGSTGASGSATSPAPGASTAPAPTSAPAVVRHPGSLNVSNLTVVQSGPRLDVSGSATLSAGAQTLTGALSGRLSLSTSTDSRGRQRLDATFTISTPDGPVEIRVAGFATAKAVEPAPAPAEGDAPATTAATTPTSYSLAGVFRATAEKFPLLTSGSASGSLGSSLSLSLSA